MKTKKRSKLPKHYTAKLSRKDKKKQEKAISKSKKSYQKGKYYTRPKMKSFKNKKSSWTQKFHELYPTNRLTKFLNTLRPHLLHMVYHSNKVNE